MEKSRRFLEKMWTFKLGLAVLLVIGLLVFPKMASAQGFYVGGGSDQYQYMVNDGAFPNTFLWQDQMQMQYTALGVENTIVAEVDTWMEGYMAQEIGDDYSAAYTETENSSYYGLSVDISGISAGASADAYAASATFGDAMAYSDAWTDITITILP